MLNTAGRVKVLDCTLRDGGYYNDWDFNVSQSEEYVNSMIGGGVDIIELGFRFTEKDDFLGPFAYSSEGFLNTLNLPAGTLFGVMLNASDYVGDDWQKKIEKCFVPREESKIGLVRIAAHFHQVRACEGMVKWLKDAGYLVGLNIMQISQFDEAEIAQLLRDVERDFVDFDALYFADSLGNLRPEDVRLLVGLFTEHTSKAVGFHGHDNIGLGVANSMAAIDAGATWIDATVTGMGRGAGNTQTEYLALELSRAALHDFNVLELQRSATGWLSELKDECKWGTNIFYYEAGLKAVHPTYVQQMLSSQKYQPLDILVMIDAISQSSSPTGYSAANIDKAIAGMMQNKAGKANVSDGWRGRPVILCGAGPNAKQHWGAVKQFADKHNAVMLALNWVDGLQPDYVEAAAVVHPARMMSLLEDRKWAGVEVYTSLASLPENIATTLNSRDKVTDYGVQVHADQDFSHSPSGCTIPAPQVIAYAWALALQQGASEIVLAGLDGYDGQSTAFYLASDLLNALKSATSVDVYSLTKTHFDVPVRPIY